jgi:membrane fusion protein
VVLLLVFGTYTRHEHVEGTLVPTGGLLTLGLPKPGIVTGIYVHAGDVVTIGQPLLEISSDQSRGTLDEANPSNEAQLVLKQRQPATFVESLRSPIAGTVNVLLVHPGQTVSTQQSLISILPSSSQLVAELWVSSKSVGYMRPGRPVVISYDGFPQLGQHVGHILEVSLSAISPIELRQILGRDVNGPSYRVEVSLDRQSLLADGEEQPLKVGMTLDADIVLDRLRLWNWIAQPVYRLNRSILTRSAASASTLR